MNDCANASIRDRLPDLVNGTLAASETATVELHVEGCLDCQQELGVIRGMRLMFLAGGRAVDVARILPALPMAPAAVPMTIRPASRRWGSWRIAAAITVVVLGGGTFALMERGGAGAGDSTTRIAAVASGTSLVKDLPVAAASNDSVPEADAPIASSPSTTASGAEMTVATAVGNLTDSQLEGLIDRIEHVEAVPLDEPVRRVIPVVLTDSIGVKDLAGGTR